MAGVATAGTTETITLEQYGELEVKVIKLRRALAHAQSVTKRQDAALSKTIDRLQTLDEEVKELKEEGNRLEDEIQKLEDELDRRKNMPEMSQKEFTEKEIAAARKEIEDLRFERAKVLVEIEKQKLCNREVGKTIEIVRKRYEHDDKKRRHEIRKLDEKEVALLKEIDKLKREKHKLLGTKANYKPTKIAEESTKRSSNHDQSGSSNYSSRASRKNENASGKSRSDAERNSSTQRPIDEDNSSYS